jgi:4-amino-4-deoxy-L-arabinose transferase-like glycosyltransferase
VIAQTAARRWPDWRRVAFWGVIVLGAALRLVALGRVPAGLNADEASSGIEALSLIQTGMDRWGNPWPIWFPAWGSGMNPLFTYLAIPAVALFGLKVVTIRAVGAVFGVLTLPVTYLATRQYFSRGVALATMALLAVLPWHVMSSRWALDSNLAPFCFTLGLFTIGKALDAGGRWPMLAFLPWAIALYAYPVVALPVGVSGLMIVILFRRKLAAHGSAWGIGILLALLLDLPFLLFLAKNQLRLGRLPLEGILPFSIPVLPATRLSQIHQSPATTIFDNLTFILGAYRDGLTWHQSVFFLPLTGAMPFLTLLGAAALGVRQVKARQPHVVLIVLASAIAPICLLPLHLTRFNWFYIPSLMVAAYLIVEFGPAGMPAWAKRVTLSAAALYFALFTLLFAPYYFFRYNDEILGLDRNLGNGFRVGLEDALKAELAIAKPDDPVFVDIGGVHPYLYVLFFGLADIKSFQNTRQLRIEDGVYRISRFDRFVFEHEALPRDRGFAFVSRSDRLPCLNPDIADNGPLWTVGRCAAPEAPPGR